MPFESDENFERLNELVMSNGAYIWLLDFAGLTPPEQALVGIWELEQEVYNGGFLQYFQNLSGNRAPFIADILRRVGAPKSAAIVERAISLVGSDLPWDDEIKRFPFLKLLSAEIKDELYALGREFYDQLDDLNSVFLRYVLAHRKDIDVPDESWVEATK